MHPRRQVLERRPMPLEDPADAAKGHDRYLEIRLTYDQGGPNYFSGGTSRRGYYISATPITNTGNGCTRFTMMSGRSAFLEEAKRFNEKRFGEIVFALANPNSEPSRVRELIVSTVLCEDGPTLRAARERLAVEQNQGRGGCPPLAEGGQS